MSTAFFRTVRELESDNSLVSIAVLAFVTLLMGAWVGWLFLARIAIYRASDQARLELVNDAMRLDAPVPANVYSVS
jgi:hypothetical protein